MAGKSNARLSGMSQAPPTSSEVKVLQSKSTELLSALSAEGSGRVEREQPLKPVLNELLEQQKGKKRERMEEDGEGKKRLARGGEAILCNRAGSGKHSLMEPETITMPVLPLLPPDVASLVRGTEGIGSASGTDKLLLLMKDEAALSNRQSTRNLSDILTRRSGLAAAVAQTENEECLQRFVQQGGLAILNDWLQELQSWMKATSSDAPSAVASRSMGPRSPGSCEGPAARLSDNGADLSFSSNESTEKMDFFLSILLEALQRLPVDLEALKVCAVGKSVNQLRSHRNGEIQKTARRLVDIWKKRVRHKDETNVSARAVQGQHASAVGKEAAGLGTKCCLEPRDAGLASPVAVCDMPVNDHKVCSNGDVKKVGSSAVCAWTRGKSGETPDVDTTATSSATSLSADSRSLSNDAVMMKSSDPKLTSAGLPSRSPANANDGGCTELTSGGIKKLPVGPGGGVEDHVCTRAREAGVHAMGGNAFAEVDDHATPSQGLHIDAADSVSRGETSGGADFVEDRMLGFSVLNSATELQSACQSGAQTRGKGGDCADGIGVGTRLDKSTHGNSMVSFKPPSSAGMDSGRESVLAEGCPGVSLTHPTPSIGNQALEASEKSLAPANTQEAPCRSLPPLAPQDGAGLCGIVPMKKTVADKNRGGEKSAGPREMDSKDPVGICGVDTKPGNAEFLMPANGHGERLTEDSVHDSVLMHDVMEEVASVSSLRRQVTTGSATMAENDGEGLSVPVDCASGWKQGSAEKNGRDDAISGKEMFGVDDVCGSRRTSDACEAPVESRREALDSGESNDVDQAAVDKQDWKNVLSKENTALGSTMGDDSADVIEEMALDKGIAVHQESLIDTACASSKDEYSWKAFTKKGGMDPPCRCVESGVSADKDQSGESRDWKKATEEGSLEGVGLLAILAAAEARVGDEGRNTSSQNVRVQSGDDEVEEAFRAEIRSPETEEERLREAHEFFERAALSSPQSAPASDRMEVRKGKASQEDGMSVGVRTAGKEKNDGKDRGHWLKEKILGGHLLKLLEEEGSMDAAVQIANEVAESARQINCDDESEDEGCRSWLDKVPGKGASASKEKVDFLFCSTDTGDETRLGYTRVAQGGGKDGAGVCDVVQGLGRTGGLYGGEIDGGDRTVFFFESEDTPTRKAEDYEVGTMGEEVDQQHPGSGRSDVPRPRKRDKSGDEGQGEKGRVQGHWKKPRTVPSSLTGRHEQAMVQREDGNACNGKIDALGKQPEHTNSVFQKVDRGSRLPALEGSLGMVGPRIIPPAVAMAKSDGNSSAQGLLPDLIRKVPRRSRTRTRVSEQPGTPEQDGEVAGSPPATACEAKVVASPPATACDAKAAASPPATACDAKVQSDDLRFDLNEQGRPMEDLRHSPAEKRRNPSLLSFGLSTSKRLCTPPAAFLKDTSARHHNQLSLAVDPGCSMPMTNVPTTIPSMPLTIDKPMPLPSNLRAAPDAQQPLHSQQQQAQQPLNPKFASLEAKQEDSNKCLPIPSSSSPLRMGSTIALGWQGSAAVSAFHMPESRSSSGSPQGLSLLSPPLDKTGSLSRGSLNRSSPELSCGKVPPPLLLSAETSNGNCPADHISNSELVAGQGRMHNEGCEGASRSQLDEGRQWPPAPEHHREEKVKVEKAVTRGFDFDLNVADESAYEDSTMADSPGSATLATSLYLGFKAVIPPAAHNPREDQAAPNCKQEITSRSCDLPKTEGEDDAAPVRLRSSCPAPISLETATRPKLDLNETGQEDETMPRDAGSEDHPTMDRDTGPVIAARDTEKAPPATEAPKRRPMLDFDLNQGPSPDEMQLSHPAPQPQKTVEEVPEKSAGENKVKSPAAACMDWPQNVLLSMAGGATRPGTQAGTGTTVAFESIPDWYRQLTSVAAVQEGRWQSRAPLIPAMKPPPINLCPVGMNQHPSLVDPEAQPVPENTLHMPLLPFLGLPGASSSSSRAPSGGPQQQQLFGGGAAWLGPQPQLNQAPGTGNAVAYLQQNNLAVGANKAGPYAVGSFASSHSHPQAMRFQPEPPTFPPDIGFSFNGASLPFQQRLDPSLAASGLYMGGIPMFPGVAAGGGQMSFSDSQYLSAMMAMSAATAGAGRDTDAAVAGGRAGRHHPMVGQDRKIDHHSKGLLDLDMRSRDVGMVTAPAPFALDLNAAVEGGAVGDGELPLRMAEAEQMRALADGMIGGGNGGVGGGRVVPMDRRLYCTPLDGGRGQFDNNDAAQSSGGRDIVMMQGQMRGSKAGSVVGSALWLAEQMQAYQLATARGGGNQMQRRVDVKANGNAEALQLAFRQQQGMQ